MATISEIKQREVTETPILLFDCEWPGGSVDRWSTHEIDALGNHYSARVLRHNLFDIRATSEDGLDGISRVSLTLANADSYFSEIQANTGFRGAKLTARFLFVNLATGEVSTDQEVIFRGTANPPDEITEATLVVTFVSRLSLQRTLLPQVRIQRRCPWAFPADAEQRKQAINGGTKDKHSPFFKCGYTPDVDGGVGSLDGGTPYSSCDYSRAQCEQRGMFNTDSHGRVTRRFGGVEFVPSSTLVKSYGDKDKHLSTPVENEARYNDFVPLVYGTAWYRPPIIFARNDGNLTHLEVLLGMGEIAGVLKVIANQVEIPMGQSGSNMTSTGWYNIVGGGSRNGGFNPDFSSGSGTPLGDPYGSMAVLSVVLPNRISDGSSLPRVEVLLQGLKLPIYGADGAYLGESFSNNPAWVLLDVLRRTGWEPDEIDLVSFATTAAYCAEPIESRDTNGNPVQIPRFQCNLVMSKRRSAADLIRGIRNNAALYLVSGLDGRLQLLPETAMALQQPNKAAGSNSTEVFNGGWPVFEFGDGSNGFGDILRKPSGEPAFRVYCRRSADSPNRYTVEFQDEFNEYQQDSLSLVDIDDSVATNQEVTASLTALGLPNFNQAGRIARLQLNKSVRGNSYVQFETGLRGVGLKPGDLITVTNLKAGLQRQPYRIVKITPGLNYATSVITAQIHQDEWYVNPDDVTLSLLGGGRQPDCTIGIPRPIAGTILRADGETQFGVSSQTNAQTVALKVEFFAPQPPNPNACPIPMLSLSPQIIPAGGTIAGATNYYYAITAVGPDGLESQPSFTVRASTPDVANTNQIKLMNLSFGAGTVAFHVYRGNTPNELYRIAANVPVADHFTDTGMTSILATPPDKNYDHCNFYWRFELEPEAAATIFDSTLIGNADLHMTADQYREKTVRISGGKGYGQERTVVSNTTTTLTISKAWEIVPDATTRFTISESSWQLGAIAKSSPATFDVPRRDGASVQIRGRSANVHNIESAEELSPLTSYRLAGSGGTTDSGVPVAPTFGIVSAGRGSLEVTSMGFTDLTNTASVTAATLTLLCWDELNGAPALGLAAALDAAADTLEIATAGSLAADSLIQIGAEVMRVTAVDQGGMHLTVTRGEYGTNPGSYPAGTSVYMLGRKAFIIPFVDGFFGSPASGSYDYPILLPNVRIAAAEMFVTNSVGNSPVASANFTRNVQQGIRTLAGGQISMQVQGNLAIESDAVPPLVVDAPHTVRDVFATVGDAPTLVPVQVRLKLDEQPYCDLTIAVGQRISNLVDGFTLPRLDADMRLGLDIVSVGQTADSLPGSDLTVTVRL